MGTRASHVWSLDHGKCACGACQSFSTNICCDYNNCQYDLSGDLLRHFYGELAPRKAAMAEWYWIDQHQYIPPPQPSWSKVRMKRWCPLYVPAGCRHEPDFCRVH